MTARGPFDGAPGDMKKARKRSSLTKKSKKPLTIIAVASASLRPRDIA
jgi:hypothetical protein